MWIWLFLFYDDYSQPSVKSIIEDYGKFDKSKYLVLECLYPKITSEKENWEEIVLKYLKKHFYHIYKNSWIIYYI